MYAYARPASLAYIALAIVRRVGGRMHTEGEEHDVPPGDVRLTSLSYIFTGGHGARRFRGGGVRRPQDTAGDGS